MGTDDKAQLTMLYKNMYLFLISKDTRQLTELLNDKFTLRHMTGMVQSKQEFLQAVRQGTLNYFFASHENIDIQLKGCDALLTGDSLVLAAVFGGGKHTWKLRQTISCKKIGGSWFIEKSVASVY